MQNSADGHVDESGANGAAAPLDDKKSPAYPIASVDKALQVLLMFREHRRLRLSDVRASLGVASSTAHRILAMLAYHDFVRQEPGLRTYIAGPALVDIGFAAVRSMDIRAYAKPVLQELAETIGETVHLVELEGNKVRYLDAVESVRALRVASRTGSLLPAHCTATGKALLAALSDEQIDELFPSGQPLVSMSEQSLSTVASLKKELATVRKAGYAINVRESDEDIASVATVVRDDRGLVVAAISASGPVSRMTKPRQREVAAELRRGAAEIGDALAGHGTT